MDRNFFGNKRGIKTNDQTDQISRSMNSFCPIHEGLRIEYVSVDPAQDCVFKCVNCVSEGNLPQSTLIPINLILTSEEKTIFANFPTTDRSLMNELRTLAQTPTTSEQVISKIQSFFKEFRTNLHDKLEKIEQKMTEKAKSISDFGSIIQLYDQICEKNQLKAIIKDEKKDFLAKSNEIKIICQEILSKESENKILIRTSLERLKTFNSGLDFKTPDSIKEKIYSEIDKIDFFLVEDFQQFQELVERNQNDNTQNRNISNLMKLINNKFNEISVESSQRLQEQLMKISFVFSAVEVPEVGALGTCLESLNENSSKAIQNLVEDLAKNQQANEADDDREDKENLIAEDLVRLMSNRTNFCSDEYIEDAARAVNTLERVLGLFLVRKPRINAGEQIGFQNRIRMNPLPIQFTKTNFKDSQLIQMIENSGLVQFSLNPSKEGQVVSEVLDNTLGYRLKLKFSRPIANCLNAGFYIGLIQNTLIHSTYVLSNSTQSGLYTYLNAGAKIILKGGQLTSTELSQTTDCVEFRFCIQKQQFLYADQSYSNINQAEAKHFYPSKQYRFGIYFRDEESRPSDMFVQISEFGTIDPEEVINFQ